MNSDVMTDVIRVMGILMRNHKCNEVENAFPIFKVSRLVMVHTVFKINTHKDHKDCKGRSKKYRK